MVSQTSQFPGPSRGITHPLVFRQSVTTDSLRQGINFLVLLSQPRWIDQKGLWDILPCTRSKTCTCACDLSQAELDLREPAEMARFQLPVLSSNRATTHVSTVTNPRPNSTESHRRVSCELRLDGGPALFASPEDSRPGHLAVVCGQPRSVYSRVEQSGRGPGSVVSTRSKR